MKSITQILVIVGLLCLIETNGRHVENEYEDLAEGEVKTDLTSRMKEHATSRHKRRSRQSFPYDYPPPPYMWADHRTEFNSHQDEYLGRILKSLDEILVYLRRPVPPQPIYIPYPVIQNRPCSCRGTYKLCKTPTNKRNETNGVLDNKFGTEDVEDANQIWGPVDVESDYDYGEGDGSRPISFEPVEPIRPLKKPAPPVDHGSNQAGASTQAPVSPPGLCETAILTCCSMTDRTATRNCFMRHNCQKTYATNRACDPQVIRKVLDHFSQAYSPNRI